MSIRNPQEAIGGCFLAATGIFVFVVAISSLNLGTSGRIGPGLFPAGCGVLLAMIGAFIALAGAFGRGGPEAAEESLEIDAKSLGIVLMALAAFAALVRPTGMVPAVFALVIIASIPEPRITWLQTIIVGAVLATFTSLIFVVGLRLPVAVVALPW